MQILGVLNAALKILSQELIHKNEYETNWGSMRPYFINIFKLIPTLINTGVFCIKQIMI